MANENKIECNRQLLIPHTHTLWLLLNNSVLMYSRTIHNEPVVCGSGMASCINPLVAGHQDSSFDFTGWRGPTININ